MQKKRKCDLWLIQGDDYEPQHISTKIRCFVLPDGAWLALCLLATQLASYGIYSVTNRQRQSKQNFLFGFFHHTLEFYILIRCRPHWYATPHLGAKTSHAKSIGSLFFLHFFVACCFRINTTNNNKTSEISQIAEIFMKNASNMGWDITMCTKRWHSLTHNYAKVLPCV